MWDVQWIKRWVSKNYKKEKRTFTSSASIGTVSRLIRILDPLSNSKCNLHSEFYWRVGNPFGISLNKVLQWSVTQYISMVHYIERVSYVKYGTGHTFGKWPFWIPTQIKRPSLEKHRPPWRPHTCTDNIFTQGRQHDMMHPVHIMYIAISHHRPPFCTLTTNRSHPTGGIPREYPWTQRYPWMARDTLQRVICIQRELCK